MGRICDWLASFFFFLSVTMCVMAYTASTQSVYLIIGNACLIGGIAYAAKSGFRMAMVELITIEMRKRKEAEKDEAE